MKWYVVVMGETFPTAYLTTIGLKEFSKPEEERFSKAFIRTKRRVYEDDINKAHVFLDKAEAESIATEVPHSRVLSEMGLIRHA